MQKLVKLTITVLIFVVIILAAPFGMGILAEKEAHKKIKEVQVKLEQYPNIEYKLVSYKRGFFKSEAEETITFKSLKVGGKEIGPVELVIMDEIKHGPVILSKDKTGKLDLWIGRAVIKGQLKKVINVGVNPLPLDVYTGYIGFRGDIKLAMDINKLSLDFPTFTAAFENFKDQLEVAHDYKKINNQLEIKQVLLTDKIKPQKFDLKGLGVITDMAKNDQALWLGSRKIEVESFTAAMEGKTYTLKGLYNKTTDLEHDKQIKSEVMLNIRSAGVGDKFYGPHHLVLIIDGMDASVLSSLNETFMKLGHENLNLARAEGTPAQAPELLKNQALVNKMGDLAADLIKKGFSIEVKSLEISTVWGTLKANSRFKIPNLSGRQQQGILQLSLLSSILSMDTVVNAQIPTGLAKAVVESRYRKMLESQNLPMQAPEMQNVGELADKHLTKLVADGWFIPKGASYDISLSFKNGEFLVNNKPLKPQGILPELAPPAAPAPAAPLQGDGQPMPANPMDPNAAQVNPQQEMQKGEENKPELKPQAQNQASPIGVISPEPEKVPASDIKPSELSQTVEEAQSAAEKKPEDQNATVPSTPSDATIKAVAPAATKPAPASAAPSPATVVQPQAQDNNAAQEAGVQ